MQHPYLSTFLAGAALLCLSTAGQAQSLITGFMAGKGHGSVVFTGTAERYRNVFLVPEKVDAVPIYREVRVSSVSLFANYGISNKVEAVVSLPFIQSSGRANKQVLDSLGAAYVNTRSGLQDLSAFLKFKVLTMPVGSSQLDLLGAVGVSTPASSYQSKADLGYIIAIGNRATKYTTVGVAQLRTPSGVFVMGQAGYSVRTNPVPDAFVADAKVGYAGLKLYAEAWASLQQSSSKGTDILQPGFTGLFTATRVNYTRVGLSLYKPLSKGVGLVLGASQYLAGRNVGQSTGVSAGVSYNY
ncbi:hypothetical protein LJ737_19280 [Hymenobacter sp. 15J16-1T3B]|uniref:hypothetical protein n=1 Tax=Hymenobacter sp. 15J16-1T3B TaxID=2886941 RepID=UPI001D1072E5|nr:hypothetical protein [Hymenobacter sp. 15J16-1T3B]MCC3159393.1 hypothetical protein [Hymenobacter sp. 15J16-1T3B]